MGEPRSWGEFMEALVKLIGQAADTGGNQTAGTVFGKENAILGILKNGGVSAVKSVQWGRYNGYPHKDISISPVNVDKSVAFAIGGTYASAVSIAYVYEFTSSTIKLSGQGVSSNSNIGASWHVIEFY